MWGNLLLSWSECSRNPSAFPHWTAPYKLIVFPGTIKSTSRIPGIQVTPKWRLYKRCVLITNYCYKKTPYSFLKARKGVGWSLSGILNKLLYRRIILYSENELPLDYICQRCAKFQKRFNFITQIIILIFLKYINIALSKNLVVL